MSDDLAPRDSTRRDTIWAILNESSGLVAVTVAFLLLGVALQPAGYGAYVGLTSVVGPLAAFSSGGVYLTLLEHIAGHGENPLDVARSCIGLAVTLGAVGAVGATVIVSMFIHGIGVVTVVILCFGDLVLGSVYFAGVGMVQVEESFVKAAKIRIVFSVLRAMMIGTLWFTHNLRLGPYAVCQAVLLFSFGWISLSSARRRLGGRITFYRGTRAHLRSVVTYALGLSAAGIQNDGDKFTLNKLGYTSDAGRYGFAYRLVQLGLLPVTALANATHVSFLDGSMSSRPLDRALRLAKVALVYVVVVVAAMWVAAPLAPRILGKSFAGTDEIIRWVTPLVVFRSVGIFALNGLLGLKQNLLRTRLLIANAAFSVLLYAVLIPGRSWLGAAYATTISEATLFSMAWFLLIRHQRLADSCGVAGSDPTADELIERLADADDEQQSF